MNDLISMTAVVILSSIALVRTESNLKVPMMMNTECVAIEHRNWPLRLCDLV